MPVVKVNGVRFLVRWKPEWIEALRYIDKNYRTEKGFISWKRAEADGLLKGFPADMDLKYISRYWSMKKKGRKWDGAQYERTTTKAQQEAVLRKRKVFKRHRFVWGEKETRLLKFLVEKHRKKSSIDWAAVWIDPLRKQLPDHYKTMEALRTYWNSKRHNDPDLNVQSSLAWRKRNKKRYREIQESIRVRKKDAKNEYLHSKLKTR